MMDEEVWGAGGIPVYMGMMVRWSTNIWPYRVCVCDTWALRDNTSPNTFAYLGLSIRKHVCLSLGTSFVQNRQAIISHNLIKA